MVTLKLIFREKVRTPEKEIGDRPTHTEKQGSLGGVEPDDVTAPPGATVPPTLALYTSSCTEQLSSQKQRTPRGTQAERHVCAPAPHVMLRCPSLLPSPRSPTSNLPAACPKFTHSTLGKFPVSLGILFPANLWHFI